MASTRVIQVLRNRIARVEREAMSDASLLSRFLASRDEAAFATLVQRHAGMVWGVCVRALAHRQDAEDAFQATFIVLFRKAASIQPPGMLANWLYGVAHQTAIKARAMNAKRKAREKTMPGIDAPAVEANRDSDVQPILDQELQRLPDKYRSVIVLCDLLGKTRAEAASQLGVPDGTVAGRLARARAMLGKRLERRGIALTAAALATAIAHNASASAPTHVVAGTLLSADAGSTSATVGAIVDGVIKSMLLAKLKSTAISALAIVALLAIGIGAIATSAGEPHEPGAQPVQTKVAPAEPPQPQVKPAADDRDRLQGVWEVTSPGFRRGETWTFEGGQIKLIPKDFLRTFTLDATKSPKQIDIILQENPDGPIVLRELGIYSLEDDTLTLLLRTDVRPTDFPKKEKLDEILILQRVQPKKEELPVGYLKAEVCGTLERNGSVFRILVHDKNNIPDLTLRVRTNADKSALNKILDAAVGRQVILTGDVEWLPKGAQVASDADWTLGIVMRDEAELRPAQWPLEPYVKVEAKGKLVTDPHFRLLVRLQDKPARVLPIKTFSVALKTGDELAAARNKVTVLRGPLEWESKKKGPLAAEECTLAIPQPEINPNEPPRPPRFRPISFTEGSGYTWRGVFATESDNKRVFLCNPDRLAERIELERTWAQTVLKDWAKYRDRINTGYSRKDEEPLELYLLVDPEQPKKKVEPPMPEQSDDPIAILQKKLNRYVGPSVSYLIEKDKRTPLEEVDLKKLKGPATLTIEFTVGGVNYLPAISFNPMELYPYWEQPRRFSVRVPNGIEFGMPRGVPNGSELDFRGQRIRITGPIRDHQFVMGKDTTRELLGFDVTWLAAQEELKRLQGEWQAGDNKGEPLRIVGDRVLAGDPPKVRTVLRLDPTKNTKQIDFYNLQSAKSRKGIYRIDGDKLILGFDDDPDRRPNGFHFGEGVTSPAIWRQTKKGEMPKGYLELLELHTVP